MNNATRVLNALKLTNPDTADREELITLIGSRVKEHINSNLAYMTIFDDESILIEIPNSKVALVASNAVEMFELAFTSMLETPNLIPAIESLSESLHAKS